MRTRLECVVCLASRGIARKVLLFLLALMVLVACVPAAPTGSDRLQADVAAGKALFAAKGCAGCHGFNGEGMGRLGPPVAGHLLQTLYRWVRQPASRSMPVYGQKDLSDADLDKIVAYVAGLGPVHGAGEYSASIDEATQLQLVLIALEVGDIADARAHLEELTARTDAQSKAGATAILESLDKGDVQVAIALTGDLLVHAPSSTWTEVQLHLLLAFDAITRADVADATQHMEEASAVASEAEKSAIASLAAQLRTGNLQVVHDQLRSVLQLAGPPALN